MDIGKPVSDYIGGETFGVIENSIHLQSSNVVIELLETVIWRPELNQKYAEIFSNIKENGLR